MKAKVYSVPQAKTPTACDTLSTQKQQGHRSDPDARPLEAALPQADEVLMTADKPTPDQPSGQVPNDTPAGFTLAHPLAQVAIDWHLNQDGEDGCAGITCPAVQRLISFGELCAWTWNLHSVDQAVPPVGQVQLDMDRLRQAIDRLQRRISEPGRFVYTSDLNLLHAAHTMLCECESAILEAKSVPHD